MSEKDTKSLTLLSGGLDSVVSLGLLREKLNVVLALTFDYGQKSLSKEIEASKWYCEYYKLEHKIIKLDWLKEITNTALVSDEEIPSEKADLRHLLAPLTRVDTAAPLSNRPLKTFAHAFGFIAKVSRTENNSKTVWVPNRNGLFLNIAGSFADSYGFKNIIIGANKEEAQNFPDNTKEFIERVNKEFEFSTLVKPQVIAPLIDCNKEKIVKLALENDIPLDKINSCYKNTEKHCGECSSCVKLKSALIANNAKEYLKKLFRENL